MSTNAIVVVGLPSSGKTTFLAALWHLIFGREIPTVLSLEGIARGDHSHLNAIADRWLRAQEQERTLTDGNAFVSLNLLDATKQQAQIVFPDVAGEAFSRMWEQRECDPEIAEMLRQGNVLLFINARRIEAPRWVLDVTTEAAALGEAETPEEEIPVSWSPALAPTQVQLVGLLSSLAEPPLFNGPRKLCVMLSAWDKAKGERLPPNEFLAKKLPLLHQFLLTNRAMWDWRVFGVSAQGGDYDSTKNGATPKQEAEHLRSVDVPANRILLTEDGESESHDLTAPLAWLTS